MGYMERKSDDGDTKPVKPEDLKAMEKDVHNALQTLKQSVESKSADTQKNVEKYFADLEEKNAKFAREYAEHQKKLDEKAEAAEKRVKDLELHIATKGSGGKDGEPSRNDPEYKNFMTFVKSGEHTKGLDISMLEQKTNRTDSDVAGGYLVPAVMEQGIRKTIVENSPVRPFARSRALPGKSLEVRRRLSGHGRALFEGELGVSTAVESKYGMERVTTYRQTETVSVSLDLLLMSPYNVEMEMYGDAMEAFALGESYNFLYGNGIKSPRGVLASDKVGTFTTATIGVLSHKDLANVTGNLKKGQDPWFFFNRRTLAKIQLLEDSTGRPLWQMPGGDKPATIYGYPYSSDFIDLDDADASNKVPIIFGDLKRGYEIFDTTGTMLIRDDVTRKKESVVEFTWNRWLTGDVLMNDAIIKMKIQ